MGEIGSTLKRTWLLICIRMFVDRFILELYLLAPSVTDGDAQNVIGG